MSASIPIELDSAVTTIIAQRPHKNQVQDYENWLQKMVPLAQGSTGHRGVNIISHTA